MTDCLIIGMNSLEFPTYLDLVRSMGTQGGAYRDLNLSFIESDGRPYQALELLSRFHVEHGGVRPYPFHNADFIWPTITYLGSFLHRHGLSFDWINAFRYEQEALRDKLLHGEVRLIAITTTLYVVPWPIQEIIGFIRRHDEHVPIVVGGPYISNFVKGATRADVEAHFDSLGADYYVISSEGEQSLVGLVAALKAGGSPAGVSNLAYRGDGRWTFTEAAAERNSLEDNRVDYRMFAGRLGQFVSTRTAKSCPFACSFCNFPEQAGAYTFMSVEDVERELDAIRDVGGVTTVTFIDDTFNVPKRRFKELLAMMRRNRYPFRWNCNFRSDHADDEIIAMMAEAGCEGVFLGVESGSAQQLKRMNKTATPQDYRWAIPRLKQEGILAHANTFIGFPGETMDTVQETVDLICTTEPATYSVQPWYANPMTPIFRRRDEHKIIGSSFNWCHRTMDAATACDLVDHVFKTVDASVFLPQYGFFQWSVFYLRALGMPVGRIMAYLRNFNVLVRDKLEGGRDPELRARMFEALRASARFEGEVEPADPAAEIYAGARRLAAAEFCRVAFLAGGRAPSVQTLVSGLLPACEAWSSTAFRAARHGLDLDPALAAFCLLLWRLNGLEPVPLLVGGSPAAPVVPMMPRPRGDASFASFVAEVEAARQEADGHAFHALDLVTNPPRFSPLFEQRVELVAGFAYGEDATSGALGTLPASVRLWAMLRPSGDSLEVELAGRAVPAVVERVAAYFEALLSDLAGKGEATLDTLGTGALPPSLSPAQAALRDEVFCF